jgi:uncharacterized lipoprotein YddW (UPF0748 family)
MSMRNSLPLLVRGLSCAALAIHFLPPTAAAVGAQPEFRAAWVATVANIDWPSRPGLSTAQQQQELIAICDFAAGLNLNALVLQVRPASDALYASPLEPWSEYLTGHQGRPPKPFYDPLEFAVEAAHHRGLQLHAWVNPFRARHPTAKSELPADHPIRRLDHAVRTYGAYRWFDPGEPEAVEHTLAVVLDIVRRYDIDGIHMDDYFYPYPVKDEQGEEVDFPDAQSYAHAVKNGETLDRNDWRRQNIDRFVERLYQEVKQAKPSVQVGISPFGIWRPGHPPGITGFDQYDKLYADARKWLREGWVDYFTPQLYWQVESKGQSFPQLLAWWQEQNVHDRHLWPGLFTSRVGSKDNGNWAADEIIHQIELTRAQPGATGHVHFSMKALQQNRGGLADRLRETLYAEPAPVPE